MSVAPLFGTDGVRAPFGEPPLERATVTALGRELALLLARDHGPAPRVVLGGDTRESTPVLWRWLVAGLEAGGARWRLAGVVPTPAVAHLARAGGAAAGIAVSASHNPHPDNGIKLLDGGGRKWPRAAEEELELRLAARPAAAPPEADAEPAVDSTAAGEYLDHLAAGLENSLSGLRLVLDTAHGAASPHARRLFARLGAEPEVIAAEPDGRNINRGCGSTHPETLARVTVAGGFPLGFAFDGDADRAILVDEAGAVRDGDAILYLWARALDEAGALRPRRVVATTMSNLGLERALAARGIELVRCGVGDRQVVETMAREGVLLGGEQSGHIVHAGLTTTGDGLLTALHIAAIVHRAGESVSELLAGFTRYPQVLRNVPVARKPDFATVPEVRAAAAAVERRLAGDGRLLLRYSGTEPLARVMIEGADQGLIEELAAELAAVIERRLGSAAPERIVAPERVVVSER